MHKPQLYENNELVAYMSVHYAKYDNGNKKAVGPLKYDKQVGLWTWWYESGKKED